MRITTVRCILLATFVLFQAGSAAADSTAGISPLCRCGAQDHGDCKPADKLENQCSCRDGRQKRSNAAGAYYCRCPDGQIEQGGKCRRVAPLVPLRPAKSSVTPAQVAPAPAIAPEISPCAASPEGEPCARALTAAIAAADWPEVSMFGEARCAARVAFGCRAFALAARNGVPKSGGARAAELLDGGCEHGDADACLDLAEVFRDGALLPPDQARSSRATTRACEHGSIGACYSLGLAASGTVQGRDYLRRACEGKIADACDSLATEYEGLDDKQNARKYAEAACKLEPVTCETLGRLTIVHRHYDYLRGFELTVRACEAGSAHACVTAGKRDPNEKMPEIWYERAADLWATECDAGDNDACAKLGELYGSGRIGPDASRNGSRARRGSELLQTACEEKEITRACTELAFYYNDGAEGFPRSPERAVALFEAGCRAGDNLACTWIEERADRRAPTFAPLAVSRGVLFEGTWPLLSGGDRAPAFAYGLGGSSGDGPYETSVTFRSSFTSWLPLGIDLAFNQSALSWPRADRSAWSIVNLNLGVNVGAAVRDVELTWDALVGWVGLHVSETLFLSCSVSARFRAGYEWWSDGASGVTLTFELGWGRHRMTGVNNDACGPVLGGSRFR